MDLMVGGSSPIPKRRLLGEISLRGRIREIPLPDLPFLGRAYTLQSRLEEGRLGNAQRMRVESQGDGSSSAEGLKKKKYYKKGKRAQGLN